MKIQIISKTNQEMRFVVEDINPQFANALRRVMVSEVPVLAIDSVDFHLNDSALYDEIIAHRLGLVPLKFDPKEFNFREDCKCEGKGCSNCEIVFVIDKKKPGTVLTGDMKSADPKIASVLFDNMPITELIGEQKFKAECVATLGRGKSHAKFQAARVFYRYYPVLEKAAVKNKEETVKSCPKNALSLDGKGSVTIDCDLCGECMKTADGELKIVGDNKKFLFVVESISGLTAEEIVLQTIQILKTKVKEFGKEIEKIK